MKTAHLLAFAAVMAGCTAPGSSSQNNALDTTKTPHHTPHAGNAPPPDPTFQFCPTQHAAKDSVSNAVISCDAFNTSRPYIQLPPDDTTSTPATLYVGLWNNNSLYFVDRKGHQYIGVDGSGNVLSTHNPPSPMAAGLEMPSSRGLFTVYLVKGTIGTYSQDGLTGTSLTVTSASPQVVVPGQVIDGYVQRAWEGTVSARTVDSMGNAKWDYNHQVKVRLEFTSMTKAQNLQTWQTTATLSDGETYLVSGTVANLNQTVRASDGTCLPSFSSMGAANTFAGATNETVSFYRLGGMHFPGDMEFVLNYPTGVGFGLSGGMGSPNVVSPVSFIAPDVNSNFNPLQILPHGFPNGNAFFLHPVEGTDQGGQKGC